MDHSMSQYPAAGSYATSRDMIADAYAAAARIPDPVVRDQAVRQLHGMIELTRSVLNDPLSQLQLVQLGVIDKIDRSLIRYED